MALEVNRASLLALHLGRMKDEGRLRPEHVSMGKLGNVNAALDVARNARQVLGANGVTLEYPVMRHMANLESVVTYEGTADVHALVVGGRRHGDPGVPGMTVARAVARTLVADGVDTVFGVIGSGNFLLANELREAGRDVPRGAPRGRAR